MKVLRALRHPPIFQLWLGEALSAVGDEVYKVALTWIAVGMIGAKAGYLAAIQCGAILVFGLAGGYWSDRWDPRRTMLYTDLARALLVLLPVAWSIFFPLSIWLLLIVAVSVASLSAFFEPALLAVVPKLVPSRDLLQAANGLMGTTSRLARAVGPTLVGLLTGALPLIHFFTLDSLSYVCSALAIARLKKNLPEHVPSKQKTSLREAVFSGFDMVKDDPVLRYVITAKTLTAGAWSLVIPLGIALTVEKMLPGNIRAFGFLLASYGVGNVGGALWLSNVNMTRPMRTMGLGFFVLGAGFSGLALLPTLPWMMLSTAIAGAGGPMNDLAHIYVIQDRYPPEKLVPFMRFRMAMEYGGMLVFLLIAPTLFGYFGISGTILIAGAVNFCVALWGLVRFGESRRRR